MIGWINVSVEAFIRETFGADKWEEVLNKSGVPHGSWVSSCQYADKVTYDLVITAAATLGVTVPQALEAYGVYFVRHVNAQGYTSLLKVLGSTVADFLQNLNDLHLHLTMSFPAMQAPAFKCEKVTPESLELHYHSMRPGLWPIVVGVLKGLGMTYFGFMLDITLLRSREAGDCDHEVFLVRYPYQEGLQDWQSSDAAQHSTYSMPHDLFYNLHPFHMLLDERCNVVQFGLGMQQRVAPKLAVGDHIGKHFKLKHPHAPLEYGRLLQELNNSFLLQAHDSAVQVKGQMVPTHMDLPGQPHQRVLLFLGSPRFSNLSDMQIKKMYLSDLPLHDGGRDFVLLAEQRQAEADLKEKFERLTVELKTANQKLAQTTQWLEEEKARAEAMLHRMSALLSACFPDQGNMDSQQGGLAQMGAKAQHRVSGSAGSAGAANSVSASLSLQQQLHEMGIPAPSLTAAAMLGGSLMDDGKEQSSRQTSTLNRIEAVRKLLAKSNVPYDEQVIEQLDLLGEGTFGKVFKGLWRGTLVAVKSIVLPANMSGQEKREKMAIMEAAISSSLNHPNIVQTYTYTIRAIKDAPAVAVSQEEHLEAMSGMIIGGGSTAMTSLVGGPPGAGGQGPLMSSQQATLADSSGVHSYEVRLVLEYCDKGSLRDVLDSGAFILQDGGVNYPAVLDTAIDICSAMVHLHSLHVLHSDLKARNIMLKSSGGEGRGVCAKVADFGLSVRIDHLETHMSNVFQGTITHMAPEIMLKGRISKAADVYAFGMILWEIYTGKHAFKGVPRALLGHQITLMNKRPDFSPGVPEDFRQLAERCWDANPARRPTFEVALQALQAMRAKERAHTQPLGHIVGLPSASPPAAASAQQLHGSSKRPPGRGPSGQLAQSHEQRRASGLGAGGSRGDRSVYLHDSDGGASTGAERGGDDTYADGFAAEYEYAEQQGQSVAHDDGGGGGGSAQQPLFKLPQTAAALAAQQAQGVCPFEHVRAGGGVSGGNVGIAALGGPAGVIAAQLGETEASGFSFDL